MRQQKRNNDIRGRRIAIPLGNWLVVSAVFIFLRWLDLQRDEFRWIQRNQTALTKRLMSAAPIKALTKPKWWAAKDDIKPPKARPVQKVFIIMSFRTYFIGWSIKISIKMEIELQYIWKRRCSAVILFIIVEHEYINCKYRMNSERRWSVPKY